MRKLVLSAAALLAMGIGSLGTIGAAQAYDPFHDCTFLPASPNGNQARVCLVNTFNAHPITVQLGKGGKLTLERFEGWLNKASIVQFWVSYKSDGTIIQIKGRNNEGKILQWGDFSKAKITQLWGEHNDAGIFQGIFADWDHASITQKGGKYNDAWINQFGDGDHASIKQNGGFANDASINQYGDHNSATVAQNGGAFNDANVSQGGNGNTAKITENGGFNNDATVVQNGNGGSANIVIDGGANNHPFVYQN